MKHTASETSSNVNYVRTIMIRENPNNITPSMNRLNVSNVMKNTSELNKSNMKTIVMEKGWNANTVKP
jgi:hypothetical protein